MSGLRWQSQNEDDLKIEDDLKKEDNLKNEDNLTKEDDFKNEDELKNKDVDDCDQPWVMAASSTYHHHPLITRFHPTSGPHHPHSLRWTIPREFTMG